MIPEQTGGIDCAEQCEIPPGVTIVETPPTQRAWSDVLHCPNDGCGRTFLIKQTNAGDPAP